MKPFRTLRLGAIILWFCGGSCSRDSLVTRDSVERAHGLKLPRSARDFQLRQWGGLLDKGILSVFEIDKNDVSIFTGQLAIKSRNFPAKRGPGDPTVNGWNVWPDNSDTFVHAHSSLTGIKRTWSGEAVPIEMLSCSSPKGDWLHVEIWFTDAEVIVKMYTDWN